MKRYLASLFIIPAVLLLPTNAVKAQSFNSALASMLQDSLSFYVSSISNIKGMSASVYLPEQGTWQGQAGLSYAGQPITPDMEFGIASNSKLFVATAILKLVDAGIVSLNDRWSNDHKIAV